MDKQTTDNSFNENALPDELHFRFKNVEGDADTVFRKIQDRIHTQAVPLFTGVSPVWKYFSIAASVMLILLSSLYASTVVKEELPGQIEVVAVAGTKTRLVLPDSSVVWLNGNSSITYPQHFTSDSRNVTIYGEALFEVKKDTEKPFIVTFDQLCVKVLGTTFNVLADKESDIIETTLLTGSVALVDPLDKNEKVIQLLKPNQQAIFYKHSKNIEIQEVQADTYASWVNGSFNFKGNTLTDIVRQLSRAYCVKIHILNKQLEEIQLKGLFNKDETLDEILSVLQISAKYSYRKVKGEIYIN